MKIAHYIITFVILGAVIWLVMAELRRMKANREVANTTAGAVAETTAE